MYIVSYNTIKTSNLSEDLNNSNNRKYDSIAAVFTHQEQASNFMQALKSGPVFYSYTVDGHSAVDHDSIKLIVHDRVKVAY